MTQLFWHRFCPLCKNNEFKKLTYIKIYLRTLLKKDSIQRPSSRLLSALLHKLVNSDKNKAINLVVLQTLQIVTPEPRRFRRTKKGVHRMQSTKLPCSRSCYKLYRNQTQWNWGVYDRPQSVRLPQRRANNLYQSRFFPPASVILPEIFKQIYKLLYTLQDKLVFTYFRTCY